MQLPESTALRLRTQLDCLPTILAGVTDDALERRSIPGKWSAREVLAHLARYQDVFLSRLRRLRTESNPILPRYRAEDDPEWPLWINRETTEIFEVLQAQREVLMHEVASMADADLTRTGIHPRFGQMTVVQWLEFFLLHEAHHLLAVLQRSREQT
jgi:uncharacterized damage-inducible protein DinB